MECERASSGCRERVGWNESGSRDSGGCDCNELTVSLQLNLINDSTLTIQQDSREGGKGRGMRKMVVGSKGGI